MQKYARKRKNMLLYLFLFFTVFLLTILLLMQIEKKLLPPLKEISHMQCKSIANEIINSSIEKTMQEINFTETSILLSKTGEKNYTTNTFAVNHFCNILSSHITRKLNLLSPEQIQIPLGAATNFSILANKGPKIPFTLLPMGDIKADYETAFQSVGINQVNYKIWVNVFIDIKIVNPLSYETITLQRKILLADLIFSGTVPSHFFQMGQQQEYLLTE